MTKDQRAQSAQVIQADRDAAADFYGPHLSLPGEVPVTAHMRAGKIDESPLIQAFASHRLAFAAQPAAVNGQAAKLKDRAIVAAEYRLHCSPHEWTDADSEAMARYIIALHGPATSRMTLSPDPSPPANLQADIDTMSAVRAMLAFSDAEPVGEGDMLRSAIRKAMGGLLGLLPPGDQDQEYVDGWVDAMAYIRNNLEALTPPTASLGVEDIPAMAQFLCDRLDELDFSQGMEDFANDYSGHVISALSRLKGALAALPSTPVGEG